jgi:succinoglycan biosynthesis protein ExoH
MVTIDQSSGTFVQKAIVSDELRTRIELSRILLISAIVFHHIRIPAELSLFSWDNLGYLRGFLQIGLLKTATSTLTIISGYLLFQSRFERDPVKFLRKKFFTLVVPMVVWNVPLAVLLFFLQSEGHYLAKYDNLSDGDLLNWLNALLGLTRDPANAPLHFLRNIIACNLIALPIAGLFRRYPVAVFMVIVVVGILNLDGPLLTRDDILIGFFLGALVAVMPINCNLVDFLYPVSVPLFLVSGFLIFYYRVDYESVWWIPHRLLGFLAVWPLIGLLNRHDVGRWLSRYSKCMFFVFLSHYYVGILLFAIFSAISGLDHFVVYFILAGPTTIAVCIGLHLSAKRYAPSLLAAVTGGRI